MLAKSAMHMEPTAERSAPDRPKFGSKIGFVLSSIGAAVGIGSLWRFPYLVSQNGGAAFVLLYIAALALIGIPLLWAELSLGARARMSPFAAFQQIAGGKWTWVGVLFIASSFVLLGYYAVIAGMTLKYALFSFSDTLADDPAAFLAASGEGTSAALYALVYSGLTAALVALGVTKGIERANLFMMPALFLIILALAIVAMVQPGAGQGLSFYLQPDFSEVSMASVAAAVGQVFFSVGIAFGLMLTYASYIRKDQSLLGSSIAVCGSLTVVAFTAGLMVFPLVFSQGLESAVIGDDVGTTSALFLTLPSAFTQLGVFGRLLMFGFFLMAFFAAITSSISALEVLASVAVDHFGWLRWRATVVAAIYAFIPGVFAAASPDALVWLDTLLSNVFLFVGGIGLCLVYAIVLKGRGAFLMAQEPDTPMRRRVAAIAADLVAFILPAVLLMIFLVNLPATVRTLLPFLGA